MGERIGIISDNSSATVLTILELWQQGKTVVMISADAPENVIGDIIDENNIDFLYCACELADKLCESFSNLLVIPFHYDSVVCLKTAGLLEMLRPHSDEIALILYSSGTTGKAKGVMLTHKAIVGNAQAVLKYMKLKSTDRIAVIKNLVHSSTIVGEVIVGILAGSNLIFVSNHNNVRSVIETIYDEEATIVCMNPTILALFMKFSDTILKDKLKSVRKIYVSGAILNHDLITRARARIKDCLIINVYGMTECGPRISSQELSQNRLNNSVGKAIDGVKIRLVDDNGDIISNSGEKGRVEVNTPYRATGYVNGNSLLIDKSGWINTKDIGFYDEDGNLYISGRIDNMLNCAGHNVYPESIEEVVKNVPNVEECLIVGAADIICGTVLYCYYSGCENAKDAIVKAMRENLLPHEIPKKLIWVDGFQYSNGKIKRKQFEE